MGPGLAPGGTVITPDPVEPFGISPKEKNSPGSIVGFAIELLWLKSNHTPPESTAELVPPVLIVNV